MTELDPAALTEAERGGFVVVSGSINPELAEAAATSIGVELGAVELEIFPDGELHPYYKQSVRGKDVFIFQSHGRRGRLSVNDAIAEQELLIDAALRASAENITAVCPYLAYMRGDRKTIGREPLPAALTIRKIQNAGANRIVAVDLHSGQSQGHFHGPFDQLLAQPVILKALSQYITPGNEEGFLMVAPDEGRLNTATEQADELGIDVAFIPKKRRSAAGIDRKKAPIQEADGRVCFIVDDIISTGGTILSAAELLMESGAKKVILAATHGTLPGNAAEKIAESDVAGLILTDTLPLHEAKDVLGERLQVVSMAPLIGRAIVEIVQKGSISRLFNGRNNS